LLQIDASEDMNFFGQRSFQATGAVFFDGVDTPLQVR